MIDIFSGCLLAISVFFIMLIALLKRLMNKAVEDFYNEYGRYPTPEENNAIFQMLISNIFSKNKNE